MPRLQSSPQAAAPQMTPQQQDRYATQAILYGNRRAIDRVQLAATGTVYPSSTPQLLIQPINVGFIKRYLICVTGTITNSGSETLTLTPWGLANLFAQNGIQYIDLNNYMRVNTSGIHLTVLASVKRRRPFGGTYQSNTNNGNNLSQMLNVSPASWGVFSAPQTIAGGDSGTFRAMFEMPLAYSDTDFRGAIYANTNNAVQQIILQWNPNPVTANPNDNTFAIYSGAAGSAGAISSATYNIYQYYLDQLPTTQSKAGVGVLLPALSLSTVYELKAIGNSMANIAANQENNYSYANERSFASTIAIYNNNGSYNGCTYGTDVNYWALVSANSTYIKKLDPLTTVFEAREHLPADLPVGCYYFSSRRSNISSQNFGNIQLTLNPSSASAGAYLYTMVEDFASLQTLTSGPSLQLQ